ncbi:bolA-like protein DDB_G0274169 [Lingula anatina]|uniref:BolA-like protein DDB_G0274169 n=1 Tax=Lingula anatina TaxID=7574 RepID=A0A1S3JWZ4_LINAN|nr:bolA-like protein DDB_G0274169 [Lingula anatina]|eukprot:XP_013414955.1 bolA-like protein DDB_G0274169 [Lingula anatina]
MSLGLKQLVTLGRVPCVCNLQVIRRLCSAGISQSSMEHEKPVESLIRKKLAEAFEPVHFEIINESYMHKVPKGSELHFRILVVSEKFENVPMIKRHRLINDALKEELSTHIHALAIVAKAPSQWKNQDVDIGKSPTCLGGFGI